MFPLLTGERVDAPLEVPATSRVFVVEPDGTWRTAASDLIFTNGIVVDDKSHTLFVAETFGARVTVFDIAVDGALSNRREWPLGFAPDGMGIDGEGRLWVADPMHMSARLIDLNGVELNRVATDQLCLACAVGGNARQTLFLCTAPTTEEEQSLQLGAARIDSVAL